VRTRCLGLVDFVAAQELDERRVRAETLSQAIYSKPTGSNRGARGVNAEIGGRKAAGGFERWAPLDVARDALQRGWNPVPARGKIPIGKSWHTRVVDDDNIASLFSDASLNIGVQLGAASGGLTDVDLDSPEALSVAPYLLPKTACIFGRASNPGSHWFFRTSLHKAHSEATIQFIDPIAKGKDAKAMLVEVRIGGGGKGAQTIIPYSVHPSREPYEYKAGCDGEPATVDGEDLIKRAMLVAAAALLARHWPELGARHGARLALAGLLVRCMSEDEAQLFGEAVAAAVSEEDIADLRGAIASTFARASDDKSITGIPTARKVFGKEVTGRVVEWLEVERGDSDPKFNSTEDILDRLGGLTAKTAADPGAPFMPEVLVALAALKKGDRAAFETLRAQLKKAGCRISALDETIAEKSGDVGGRAPTQADTLIDLAQSAELFHTPDGTGFADLDVNGHRETWPIRAKGFKRWLARRFFEERGGAPSSEALQSALNVIEAKAHFDAPERIVHIRVGGLDGRLYLDLGDDTWRAVEIDASGWRVIENPPVRFRRASGMKPLPIPVCGGSVEPLRSFLNVKSDADFALVVAWALACLRNRGPYPVIVLSGEQGSAKSTFSAILRALLDPNTAPLRALPREDRDLFIAASNGHVLAFDNVSGLPFWISDTLCRLATGGGFAVHQLYTDQDEVLFDAARPVILNGIEDIVTRPDLADRAVFLTLEPIQEEHRRPEAELWAAFEAERPHILGALLDAVSKGLGELPHTRLGKLPRMADFALWATACETALWPRGTFWSAYCDNGDDAVESVIEADPVATAVRVLMLTQTQTTWTGTASELLDALGTWTDERVVKSKSWPVVPRALAGRLRRAATFLRKVGIEIGFEREGRARTRIIRITTTGEPSAPETRTAQPSGVSAKGQSSQRLRIT
jgi:hypothetical protein